MSSMFVGFVRNVNMKAACVVAGATCAATFAVRKHQHNNNVIQNAVDNKANSSGKITYSLTNEFGHYLWLAMGPLNLIPRSIISVSNCESENCQCKASEHSSAVTTGNVDQTNKGVLEVTGNSFEEAVLKSDGDVMVVFYAPWCGYCKRLMPVWRDLAEAVKDKPSVTIAQIDMTQHDVRVPGVIIHGYPTIYLFKQGQKGTPIPYHSHRDVASFAAFINRHA